LFAFLPAKGGVGATTVAVNTCAALARLPESRVLLTDFSVGSGTIRFMLNLNNGYSLQDAVEHSIHMDEAIWSPLISRAENMDILHAGSPNPELRVQVMQVQNLLDYARRNYRTICLDLSGTIEKYSIEIMQESKRIFLICTPDAASLHLARRKYQFLRDCGVGDRIGVLLNPPLTPARSLSLLQIEEILGLPVQMTFVNDPKGNRKAMHAGRPVDTGCELGKQYTELAGTLSGMPLSRQLLMDRLRN
jgi:pilus assembly protein CpaE